MQVELDELRPVNYIPNGMECSTAIIRTRGRPREFDPDTALASALRVFWEQGYDGASMEELTEAMGITKPSLYACFGNKEALFKKALDLYEREKLCYIRTALEAPSARGVAERLLHGAVEAQCGNSDPQGCLRVIGMAARTTAADSIRQDLAARRASSEAVIAERFERARAEGDLPQASDPKRLAQCLLTMIQGTAVRAQAGTGRDELMATIDTFMTMWPSR